ncbi:regulatory protein RecX [Schaalia canis]|uniref:Regulatory protein RecX n=1 Tax=Schaalia canis TaxID=100469 RepID=A0A3P1SGM6_9ACTO|nr:regulatory protein RecX [Schaalia canis]RRC96433.1 regulatory protein RecX [Schaalia canis]
MVRYLDPEHYPELGENNDFVDIPVFGASQACDADVSDADATEGAITASRRQGKKTRSTKQLSPAERMAAMREKNAALTGVEAIEAAREVALRQLDTRSRSRAELHAAITHRGFSEEIAQEVLDRLSAVGLIDDAAFAAMIVRERFALRGATGRALREELKRKGIDSALIAQAMSQISDDDAYERARELAQRKARSMRGVDRRKAWGRLSGMLARKGYSPSTCQRVIAEVLEHWGEDGQEEEL